MLLAWRRRQCPPSRRCSVGSSGIRWRRRGGADLPLRLAELATASAGASCSHGHRGRTDRSPYSHPLWQVGRPVTLRSITVLVPFGERTKNGNVARKYYAHVCISKTVLHVSLVHRVRSGVPPLEAIGQPRQDVTRGEHSSSQSDAGRATDKSDDQIDVGGISNISDNGCHTSDIEGWLRWRSGRSWCRFMPPSPAKLVGEALM